MTVESDIVSVGASTVFPGQDPKNRISHLVG